MHAGLVLSRKADERIVVTLPDGRRGYLLVCEIRSDKVRLAFDFPDDVEINREEVQTAIDIEEGREPELDAEVSRARKSRMEGNL